MALEREGFELLLQTLTSFTRDRPGISNEQTEAEIKAVIASFEAQFGGTLSPEQRNAISEGTPLTEPQLEALPERTEETTAKIEEATRKGDIQRQELDLNTLQGNILRTFSGQEEGEFARNVLSQLGPDILTLSSETGTGTQGEIRQQRNIEAIISEALKTGQDPSDAVARLEQDISKIQTQEQQVQFEEALTGRRTELESQQELERAFTAAGGLATPQSIAQLAGVTTAEEAQAIAQESIARQEALEQGRLQEFEQARTSLSEELAGIGGRELELAQPDIQRRLQSLGILRGGEQIAQTQEAAERLSSERQRILAGFGREDILQARGLSAQFGQQARGLALQERGQTAAGLQGLLSTRLGAQREDITGARQFGQQQTLQTQQLTSASREAERQRQFEFQLEQQRIQRATELAQLQRQQQRGGLFGQIAGGALGGLFGFGLGGGTGGLIGSGLGSILGGGFGGGGGSQIGGTLLGEGLTRSFAPQQTTLSNSLGR